MMALKKARAVIMPAVAVRDDMAAAAARMALAIGQGWQLAAGSRLAGGRAAPAGQAGSRAGSRQAMADRRWRQLVSHMKSERRGRRKSVTATTAPVSSSSEKEKEKAKNIYASEEKHRKTWPSII